MRRTIPVAALLVVSTLSTSPALAAKAPAHTTISAHLTPSTALVGSSAAVTGTIRPTGGNVVLQRLVGKTWKSLAHKAPSAKGAFTFSVRAKTASTWTLRVTRAASKTAKVGISPRLILHVVPTSYLVAAAAAPVTAPAALTVTGSVAPKASGSVLLQRLVGSTWTTLATGKLSHASAFSIQTTLPAGSATLRVVKPFSSKIAAGSSPALTATVQPPTPAPAITTTVLPQARVGQAYAAALTATGGTGSYTWSATGLPTGLALSSVGVLTGTPAASGNATLSVTVMDAAGRTATGSLTIAVATAAGRLFSVGAGTDGQLGNGGATDAHTIVPVVGQTAVTSVAASNLAALDVAADGTVWAWGNNHYGALGTVDPIQSLVPVHVPGLTNVTAVATTIFASLALRADGTVWTWGNNTFGELGDGGTVTRFTPGQVANLTGVVAIAGGGSASCYALRSDGTVWAWGNNASGQLGDGGTTNSPTPTQIAGLDHITAIAAGNSSAYALRSDGSVFSWGGNGTGQLGDGTTSQRNTPVRVTAITDAKGIAASDEDGYALSSSGTVLAWGSAADGNLGNGTTTPDAKTPVAVPGLADVREISGAGDAVFARLGDGSVWGWGGNPDGELGDNSLTNRSVPVAMLGVTAAIGLASGQGDPDVLAN